MKKRNREMYWVYLLIGIAMFTSVAGIVLIDQHYQQLSIEQAQKNAETVTSLVNNARVNYSKILSEIRTQTNLVTGHDHELKDGVVPNPATFSIELAQSVSNAEQRVWMYSYHPFTWRKETAVPKNVHETESLALLTANPEETYMRVLDEGSEKKFFYAIAVVMQDQSCVDCHNNHPASSKISWEVGETRAILATESTLDYEQNYSLLFIFIFVSLLSIFSVVLYFKKNKEWLASEIIGRTDSLTKIPNRTSVNEHITQQFEHHKTTNQKMGVMMVDIDNFKAINDNYGHDIGDECIVAVANTLSTVLRANDDYVARWGGEEFLVLLHESNVESAKSMADCLLAAIHKQKISIHNLTVTFSLGLVVADPNQFSSFDEIIRQADQALLKAKFTGKNCYVIDKDN